MSDVSSQRIGPAWWNSHWTVFASLVLGAAFGAALNLGIDLPEQSALHRASMTALSLVDGIKEIFMRLLTMLVAPLILFSIMAGLAQIADPKSLGRLGLRTFTYYIGTSLLAILSGLFLVNLIRPGVGAELSLDVTGQTLPEGSGSLGDLLIRAIPSNIFDALANGRMLEIIVFALLAGVAATRLPGRAKKTVTRIVSAGFELMIALAHLVLATLPIAVFALVARVAARSGGAELKPLLLYAMTIVIGLAFHALIVLPVIFRLVTGISPRIWARSMAPALLTAFSTSSSSATLPVTIDSVERRGGVPNSSASFVLPLGATINMDGTALYECVGAIFLAQFYMTAQGIELTITQQLTVVVTALLASIGAAGIPSAGLVMMTVILRALDLPAEGALLLLAVDRPLDMMRTSVNVWSDTVGAAVVGTFEGSPPDPRPA